MATVVTTTLAGSVLFGEYGSRLIGAGHFTAGVIAFLAAGVPYAATAMLFFLAHEMGHYVACRRYGVDCTVPYFIPALVIPFGGLFLLPPFGTFGAVIRIKAVIPSRRALFDIGIAGPLAGFVVAVPLLVFGTLTARELPVAHLAPGTGITFGDSLLTWGLTALLRPGVTGTLELNPLYLAGWFGMLATALNLFPAGQLDGGHIAYALFPAWHRAIGLATGGFLLGLVSMRGLYYHELSAWMLWTLVVLLFGRNHPPLPEWEPSLGTGRRVLAGVALVILVISFMPVPIGD